MTERILCDSDVLIAHLRGDAKVTSRLETFLGAGALLATTPITVAEIVHGMRESEGERTFALFSLLFMVPITDAVGRRAGEYLKKYRKSHALELADALIAAAAQMQNFALYTKNLKHYPMPDVRKIGRD